MIYFAWSKVLHTFLWHWRTWCEFLHVLIYLNVELDQNLTNCYDSYGQGISLKRWTNLILYWSIEMDDHLINNEPEILISNLQILCSPVHSVAPCRPSPSPSQPARRETAPEDRPRVTTLPQLWQQMPFASPQLFFFSLGAAIQVVKGDHHGRLWCETGGHCYSPLGSSLWSETFCSFSSGASAVVVYLQSWWQWEAVGWMNSSS